MPSTTVFVSRAVARAPPARSMLNEPAWKLIVAPPLSSTQETRFAELDSANMPSDIDAIPTTAMRGTDSAALASVCTEGRLAELDGANLPTDVAAIPTTAMRGTDSAALASVCTETRLAELAAANLPTDVAAIPTTAMRGTDNANTTTPPTVAQIQAEIEENAASLLDTIRDELANGVDGLTALKTAIAAIPTTMVGTDNAALASQITASGPTKAEMDTAHGLLATEAKQDIIDTVVDAIKVVTDKFLFTVANLVNSNVKAISDDTTAADNLEALMDGVLVVVVNDGSATTTAFATDGFTEASDDHFNGRLITFITGALAFQQTDITDYDAAGGAQGSQEFTVTALTEAPANNDIAIVH